MASPLGGVEPTQTPERAAPAPRSPKRRAKRGHTAKLARALAVVVDDIEGAARKRQRVRAAGERFKAQRLTTDLGEQYGKVRDLRAGEMPNTIRRAGPSPADDRRPGGGMAR